MNNIRTLCIVLLSLVPLHQVSAQQAPSRSYEGPVWKTGRGYVSSVLLSFYTPIGDGVAWFASARPGGGNVIKVLSSVAGTGVLAVQIVPNQDIIVLAISPKRTGLPNWEGWIKYTVMTERSPHWAKVGEQEP